MSARKAPPKPIDPTDWANKQKAAKEHAKRLREERMAAATGGSNFTPEINKRPSYLGDKPTKSPSQTQLATQKAPSHPSLDVFEQPLPGNSNSNIYEDYTNDDQDIATKPTKRNPQPLANYANNRGSPGMGNRSVAPAQPRSDGGRNAGSQGAPHNRGGRRNDDYGREDNYNDQYGRGGGYDDRRRDDYGDYGNGRGGNRQQDRDGGRPSNIRNGNDNRNGDYDSYHGHGDRGGNGYDQGGCGRNHYDDHNGGYNGRQSGYNDRSHGYDDRSQENGYGRRNDYYDDRDQPPQYRSQFTQQQVQNQNQNQNQQPARGRRASGGDQISQANQPSRYSHGGEPGWNDDPSYRHDDEGQYSGVRGNRNQPPPEQGAPRRTQQQARYPSDDYDHGNMSSQMDGARMQPASKPGRRKAKEQPAWNDDFTTADTMGGTGSNSNSNGSHAGVNISSRPPFQNNVERDEFLENMDKNYDQKMKSKPVGQGRGSRRAAQQRNQETGWNNDTTVAYNDDDNLASGRRGERPSGDVGVPRTTPRGQAGNKGVSPGHGSSTRLRSESQPEVPAVSVSASADVAKARSGLSLLKSRIKRGGNDSSQTHGGVASSTSSSLKVNSRTSELKFNNESQSNRSGSAPSEYSHGGYGQSDGHHGQQGLAYRSSSATYATPRKDQRGNDEDHNYVPTDAVAKRRGVGGTSRTQQRHPEHDLDLDTPPKPSRNTGDRYGDKYQHSSGQPPGQQQRQQSSSNYPAGRQGHHAESQYMAPEETNWGQQAEEEAALAAHDADAYGDPNQPQMECPDCGRKFNESAFARHVKICKKVFVEKRKTFDSSKHRVAEAEQLKLMKKAKEEERRKARQTAMQKGRQQAGKGNDDVIVQEKIPKWKADREQFLAAIKAGKAFSKAQAEGKPLPPMEPSGPDPTLTPCPHCGRRFNEKAAERHIPQCQNIKAQPKALKRGSGTGIGAKNKTLKSTGSSSGMPKRVR